MIVTMWKREWRAVFRNRSAIANPIAFLFLGVLLFNLSLTSFEPNNNSHAIGMLWLLVLITNFLSLDVTFRRDFENGLLEQIFVVAEMPFLVIFLKVIIHWIVTGFLVSLLSPLLGLLMGLPSEKFLNVFASLLVGTVALSFWEPSELR